MLDYPLPVITSYFRDWKFKQWDSTAIAQLKFYVKLYRQLYNFKNIFISQLFQANTEIISDRTNEFCLYTINQQSRYFFRERDRVNVVSLVPETRLK